MKILILQAMTVLALAIVVFTGVGYLVQLGAAAVLIGLRLLVHAFSQGRFALKCLAGVVMAGGVACIVAGL